MALEPEHIQYDPSPMLNSGDAFYLGQLHALGLAMPNDGVLRTPARKVTRQEINTDLVQGQMDRMIQTARTIEEGKIGIFGGLAFNQMRLNGELDAPLDIMLVPAGVRSAPVEVCAKYGEFQLLVNATFRLPWRLRRKLWKPAKVGCFSSGITSVTSDHASRVYGLKALNRYGERVKERRVEEFASVSLQHEKHHLKGWRAADAQGVLRNLVHRDELVEYRKITPENAAAWPIRQSDQGWEKTTTDPAYLLPTFELQDAFLAGQDDIHERGLAIAV